MPKKIIDIAKEVGIGPYDLVEELKIKGFDVRNPMTELSDEDTAKIIAEHSATEDTPKKKAVIRKKATKKKVVKKVVAAESEETPSEDVDKKSSTVRRKKVIRRKTSDDTTETLDAAPEETNEVVASGNTTIATPKVVGEVRTSGLQIVSHAPKPEVVETPAVKEVVEKAVEPVKEERPRFGLRVVKEADPAEVAAKKKKEAEKSEKPSRPAAPGTSTTAATSTATSTDDTRKKIGGLASMMSGKKQVSKAAVISQTRSDQELKSYAALSSLGRPIYTQVKRKKLYSGPSKSTSLTEIKESKRYVSLHGGATLGDLSKKLNIKFKELKDMILKINLLGKVDDFVGLGLAAEISALYGYRVEDISFKEDEVIGKVELSDDQKSGLPVRNPIITIMGHVDHGKTTLLDYIRKAKVASGEAGGITQHIGAYSVEVNGKTISFLDTPGHAAFASMRQRGADITDIVVLVVAADDGVMPQTRESIKFCQNAGKPVIVAVNKMDKEGANPDHIKSELANYGITPEDWGGDTQFVHISALLGDGVDTLLEGIALQAEMMELRADPKGQGEGVVIESRIEQGRGPVATVLLQTGTLKKGESIVVGETYGRARNITNDRGESIASVGPSTPVQIIGLAQAPSPGDILNVVKNEREAKKIAANREFERKDLLAVPAKKKVTLEDFFASAGEVGKEQKILNLIIRSDVQGSFEAIKQALEAIGTDEVAVKVIAGGVGAISDSDVMMAASSGGFIIGFNMRPMTSARRLAEQHGVDVKTYSIIYEVINDITLALEGMLDPESVEEFIGRAEVRDTFSIPKIGFIAGSIVIDGKIQVGCNIRLLRQGKIVFDGKMSSLKRFKDDVKEVKNGYECGIGLESFTDVKVNDIFEAYLMIERKRTLEESAQAL
ncbi:MAG: translation initiation factor IF-2 [Bacteriovoracaceae bacterium]|nr:translation initiation factor IF-2 [Bacteriovoracaceae bacterium]